MEAEKDETANRGCPGPGDFESRRDIRDGCRGGQVDGDAGDRPVDREENADPCLALSLPLAVITWMRRPQSKASTEMKCLTVDSTRHHETYLPVHADIFQRRL